MSFVGLMAKHLPPSGASLRLLDIGGQTGVTLAVLRPDINLTVIEPGAAWSFAADSFDAITALDVPVTSELLENALTTLRPGGRLILVDSDGVAEESHVRILEMAGFTRILVEDVLMRGEKPHTEERTVDRILQVANQDAPSASLQDYRGRFVYLLIEQTPNKPVWALRPDDLIEWRAVSVGEDETLLVFSSLPRAVAFMQPAVMAGLVTGVNKVAKFKREVVLNWTRPLLLNASIDVLKGQAVNLVSVDHDAAEAPDE